MGDVETEVEKVMEILTHRVRDYGSIVKAVKAQDKLRREVGGAESTEIIRKWRDAR